MKKILMVLFIIVAFIGIGLCMVPKTNAESPKGQFGMTYHRATLEDKPIILVFYVDWCTYCQKLLPKIKIINAIYQNTYNVVLVNCEDPGNKELVDDYFLTSYPTIYIVDPRIQNRVHIDNGYYDDINLIKRELDRYLVVRKLIK